MRFKNTGALIKKKLSEKKSKDSYYSGVWLGKKLVCTSQFVSNWKRGVSAPPLGMVKYLCHLLDIPRSEYEKAWLEDCKKDLREAFK